MIKRRISFMTNSLLNLIQIKNTELRAKLFYTNPDLEVAQRLWNVIEQGTIKQGSKIFLPNIAFHEKVYFPDDIFPYIDIEFLKKPQKLICMNLQYTKDVFKKQPNFIKVRVLSNQKLKKFGSQRTISSIIIHIHGGGFIAMSSNSHQVYTRLVSKKLDVPIFSIDYKKAPEFPFPHALNDCFQSYMQIIQICDKVYNIDIDKIILMGDSAGGNLIASLNLLLTYTGLRQPDGLMLVYPALNLNDQRFTPSFNISLEDQLLPYSFLKICLKAYLGQNVELGQTLDIVSPILQTEQTLKKSPPTRIIVGDQDVFHDDCLRYAVMLKKQNVDVKLCVIESFPHGFMHLDIPIFGIPQAANAINKTIDLIRELLETSN